MQKSVKLYAFGRQLQYAPYTPHTTSYIVARFHYVNSGSAVVYYSKKEHTLTVGNLYLLPQSSDFRTVQANDFDHTFFDFKSSFVLNPNSFTEIPGEKFGINTFFKFINDALRSNQLSIATAQHFCSAFISHLEQNTDMPYLTDTHILKAMNILNNSPDITIDELTKKLNLNKSYFIRLFSKTVGVSPMKYIRTSRLSEGMHMLKSGMSVAAVSEYCGYTSANAFWKAFRKEFGFAPTQMKAHAKTWPKSPSSPTDNTLYRSIHIYMPFEKTPLEF